ncbi:MAG: transcriptional repressor [Patescibacteria group bacterium]
MPLIKLLEKVKSLGGRLTKVRQAVLKYLIKTKKPISALEIMSYLSQHGLNVNRTTVYRELSFLVKNQLAQEVRLIGQATRFELSGEHRHHLICLKCRKIEMINLAENLIAQEKKIKKTKKFKITSHALEFYGLCKKCDH